MGTRTHNCARTHATTNTVQSLPCPRPSAHRLTSFNIGVSYACFPKLQNMYLHWTSHVRPFVSLPLGSFFFLGSESTMTKNERHGFARSKPSGVPRDTGRRSVNTCNDELSASVDTKDSDCHLDELRAQSVVLLTLGQGLTWAIRR